MSMSSCAGESYANDGVIGKQFCWDTCHAMGCKEKSGHLI